MPSPIQWLPPLADAQQSNICRELGHDGSGFSAILDPPPPPVPRNDFSRCTAMADAISDRLDNLSNYLGAGTLGAAWAELRMAMGVTVCEILRRGNTENSA